MLFCSRHLEPHQQHQESLEYRLTLRIPHKSWVFSSSKDRTKRSPTRCGLTCRTGLGHALSRVRNHEILLGASLKAKATLHTTKNVAMQPTVNSWLGNTADHNFTTGRLLRHSARIRSLQVTVEPHVKLSVSRRSTGPPRFDTADGVALQSTLTRWLDNSVVHKLNAAAIDFMSVVNPTSNFALMGKVIVRTTCVERQKRSQRLPSPASAVQPRAELQERTQRGSFLLCLRTFSARVELTRKGSDRLCSCTSAPSPGTQAQCAPDTESLPRSASVSNRKYD